MGVLSVGFSFGGLIRQRPAAVPRTTVPRNPLTGIPVAVLHRVENPVGGLLRGHDRVEHDRSAEEDAEGADRAPDQREAGRSLSSHSRSSL